MSHLDSNPASLPVPPAAPRAAEDMPPPLHVLPTVFPTSPPLEETLHGFWQAGATLRHIDVRVEPPEDVLEILERLGSSPFPRGGFPVIGFLASTYDKVSRFALERGSARMGKE